MTQKTDRRVSWKELGAFIKLDKERRALNNRDPTPRELDTMIARAQLFALGEQDGDLKEFDELCARAAR